MWSRSYLHFGLFHLLANASSNKMEDDFVKKYTARINEETVPAPMQWAMYSVDRVYL